MREAIAWWLQATGGYGVKLVNPGGVEMWKRGNGNVTSLDDDGPRGHAAPASSRRSPPPSTSSGCRTRSTSTATTSACPATTARRSTRCDTLEGRRAHLAHLQFHAYGGRPGGRPRSRAPELAEYLGAHPELSADVGQVMFGPATTMTADAPVSAVLREITHGRWVNADTEAETGCGIVPFTYRESNYVHALQWGIGLELFLLSRDPWRLVLSTDHPNGGSFLSYPRLIRLLMDREFRNEQIRPREQAGDEAHRPARRPRSRVHARGDRDHHARRAGAPARAARQGPSRRRRRRRHHDLRRPRRPRGDVRRAALRDQGRARGRRGRRAARGRAAGRLLRVGAEYDPSIEPTLEKLFEDRYSVQFSSYPVREPWLLEPARTVAARGPR